MSWETHLFVPTPKYESAARYVKFGMVKMGASSAKATVYFGAEIAAELGIDEADRYSVQIGTDQHDGQVRLVKDDRGPFEVRARTFKGKTVTKYLTIGPVEKFGKAKRETQIVDYKKLNDGSIVVSLPPWYEQLRKHSQPKQPVTPQQRHAQEVRKRLGG